MDENAPMLLGTPDENAPMPGTPELPARRKNKKQKDSEARRGSGEFSGKDRSNLILGELEQGQGQGQGQGPRPGPAAESAKRMGVAIEAMSQQSSARKVRADARPQAAVESARFSKRLGGRAYHAHVRRLASDELLVSFVDAASGETVRQKKFDGSLLARLGDLGTAAAWLRDNAEVVLDRSKRAHRLLKEREKDAGDERTHERGRTHERTDERGPAEEENSSEGGEPPLLETAAPVPVAAPKRRAPPPPVPSTRPAAASLKFEAKATQTAASAAASAASAAIAASAEAHKAEVMQLKVRVMDLEGEREAALQEAAQARAELGGVVTACEEVVAELNARTQAEAEAALRERSEQDKKHAARVSVLNAMVAEVRKRKDEALSAMEDMSGELGEGKEEINKLAKGVDSRDVQLASMKEKVEAERVGWEEEVNVLTKAYEERKVYGADVKARYHKLKGDMEAELTTAAAEAGELEKRLGAETAAAQNARDERERAVAELEKTRVEMDFVVEQLDAQKAEVGALQKDNGDLESDLSAAVALGNALREERDALALEKELHLKENENELVKRKAKYDEESAKLKVQIFDITQKSNSQGAEIQELNGYVELLLREEERTKGNAAAGGGTP